MQYFVHRAGTNQGPYSLAELQQQLTAGSIQSSDLAWHEGLPQWQTVASLVSTPTPPVGSAAIPLAAMTAAPAGSAEQTRQLYFSHEQQVRSVGTWFWITGLLQIIFSVLLLLCGTLSMVLAGATGHPAQTVLMVVEGGIFLVLGGFTFWAGLLLRRLDRRALVMGVIMSAIGLLGFPLGTILSAVFLYLLLCEKGRFVLSDPYRAVVAATPQYQWKTAIWVWILLGVLVLLFVSIVAISVLLALGQTVRQVGSGAGGG